MSNTGISRLTLYAIANNEGVQAEAIGPDSNNGTYAGMIILPGDPPRPLLSSTLGFDTGEQAIEAMEAIIRFAKMFTASNL